MSYVHRHAKTFIVFLALLALCVATYSNSLHNDFLIDDHDLLFSDTKIRNLKFLPEYFASGIALNRDAADAHVYYRPLAHVIPMICYQFFREDPFGYHVVNLMLFFIGCMLIYKMVNMLQEDWRISFLTSALFCVHPLNGMLVNYITANVLAVQIIVMVISVMAFMKSFEQKGSKLYLFASLAAFFTALLCHEASLVLPLYLMLVCYVLKRQTLQKVLLQCLPHFCVAGVYMFFRLQHASLKASIWDNIVQFDMTFLQYMASFNKLIVWYLSKIFFLKGVVLIWATKVVAEYLVVWLLVFFCLLTVCIFLIRYWQRDTKTLGLLWFFIGFIPVSVGCLVHPHIGLIIEPHWLFFPSIGGFLLLALFLFKLSTFANRKVLFVFVSIIVFMNIHVSRENNRLWGNEIAYSQYWAREVPGYSYPVFLLASSYAKGGQLGEAKKFYHQALEGRDSDHDIYVNLGLIAFEEGDNDLARNYFTTALALQPQSVIVYNNLGLYYLEEGDVEAAEKKFLKAAELDPYLLEPKLNLALIYQQQGHLKEARQLYEENLRIDPLHRATLMHLIKLNLENDSQDEALKLADRILKSINDAKFLTNTGSLFASHKQTKMAYDLYKKALRRDPQYTASYIELGKLLGNLENFDQAIAVWQRGAQIDPGDQRFSEYIAQAKALRMTQGRE